MSLLYIPDIETAVLSSCKDLIDLYGFNVRRQQKNEFLLISEKCGIRIMAGISPIGERQIEIDFYNPQLEPQRRRYYNHTFLLYIGNRSEPRDVMQACHEEKEDFDETLSDSLKCFTIHTLKYRKDILGGDFSSWLPS